MKGHTHCPMSCERQIDNRRDEERPSSIIGFLVWCALRKHVLRGVEDTFTGKTRSPTEQHRAVTGLRETWMLKVKKGEGIRSS